MLRLCLLDGLVFDYGDGSFKVPIRVVPGTRDLYRQYCKRLGKSLPTEYVKPTTIPTVPRKKVEEMEDRFLSRCLALDKGFSLLPEGEGVIGQLFTGGRARIVWELMSERDQQALAKAVQQQFAAFCERQGTPLPQAPAQPTVAEILAPAPTPLPVLRIGDFAIGSVVTKKGGANTIFKITGFQNESHAICEFRDEDNGETVSDLVVPLSSLALVKQ
jgi:hypothetical protein